MSKSARSLPSIGWREWLALPDLGIDRIKAKVDTGARSSTIHAHDVELVERKGLTVVRFKVHPVQRTAREVVRCKAKLLEHRSVRSSSGAKEIRPVVRTRIRMAGRTWWLDLTLTSRDEMGFRMLLGREAVRRRFVVNPGRSFLADKLAQESRQVKESQ